MGLRCEDRRIGEHTYRVRQLKFSKARPLQLVVLRAIGPTFAALLEQPSGSRLTSILDGEVNLRSALDEFSNALSEDDYRRITEGLAEQSWIVDAETHGLAPTGQGSEQGCAVLSPSVCEEHWPPRYNEFLGWLAFAIEVNFASFLGGKLNVKAALLGLAKATSASTSPTASTGTSGESSAPPG